MTVLIERFFKTFTKPWKVQGNGYELRYRLNVKAQQQRDPVCLNLQLPLLTWDCSATDEVNIRIIKSTTAFVALMASGKVEIQRI